MKTLIVEDDFTSRLLLQKLLQPHGAVHVAVDGEEAIEAFKAAIEAKEPYDLVCLDIMMPRKDGQAVLWEIRQIDMENGRTGRTATKVIMITARTDQQNVIRASTSQCEAYLVKPLDKSRLIKELCSLELIKEQAS